MGPRRVRASTATFTGTPPASRSSSAGKTFAAVAGSGPGSSTACIADPLFVDPETRRFPAQAGFSGGANRFRAVGPVGGWPAPSFPDFALRWVAAGHGFARTEAEPRDPTRFAPGDTQGVQSIIHAGCTSGKSLIRNSRFNIQKGGGSGIRDLQSGICNLESAISNLESAIWNLQSPIWNPQSPIWRHAIHHHNYRGHPFGNGVSSRAPRRAVQSDRRDRSRHCLPGQRCCGLEERAQLRLVPSRRSRDLGDA